MQVMQRYCQYGEAKSNYDGYNALASLYHDVLYDSHLSSEDIKTITIPTKWLDGNLCAPLGVVIRLLQRQTQLKICSSGQVENLLRKNGFYEQVVINPLIEDDVYHTTIPFSEFRPNDYDGFCTYLGEKIPRNRLPAMSDMLWQKFIETFAELFANAATHSETRYTVACGQAFPNYKRLNFSIADAGIGFKNRLIQSNVTLNGITSDDERFCVDAIEWALQEGSSTKKDISGGLGMYLLRQFIVLNGGKLQIASDRGYWELRHGKVEKKILRHPFPGTVITLIINTADKATYSLSKE